VAKAVVVVAEVETVSNDSKQVVMAVNRRQQHGDGGDLLGWMASGEVHVRAIGNGGINGRCCWWTCGIALVRLWDSGCGSTRNK
jgi:hypothetical protein